jgi:hypothetical protein
MDQEQMLSNFSCHAILELITPDTQIKVPAWCHKGQIFKISAVFMTGTKKET